MDRVTFTLSPFKNEKKRQNVIRLLLHAIMFKAHRLPAFFPDRSTVTVNLLLIFYGRIKQEAIAYRPTSFGYLQAIYLNLRLSAIVELPRKDRSTSRPAGC